MTSFAGLLDRLMRADPFERPTDRELADVGLSRIDYDLLASGRPGARARIAAMAKRCGLDIDEIDRGRLLDLSETCAHCVEAKSCARAIANDAPPPTNRCPNAAVYAELGRK